MEELVLVAEPLDLGANVGHQAELCGDRSTLRKSRSVGHRPTKFRAVLLPDEGGTPGVGPEAGVLVVRAVDELDVAVLDGRDCRDGIVGAAVEPGRTRRAGCRASRTARTGSLARCSYSARSRLFCFFNSRAAAFTSPSIGWKASSGIPLAKSAGVAPSRLLPHWMWWSRNESGLPGSRASIHRADLAQLDGHRVDVHAVDAVADHVAQGLADGLGRRLLFAGAGGSQPLGDTMGGGDQESGRCRTPGRTP